MDISTFDKNRLVHELLTDLPASPATWSAKDERTFARLVGNRVLALVDIVGPAPFALTLASLLVSAGVREIRLATPPHAADSVIHAGCVGLAAARADIGTHPAKLAHRQVQAIDPQARVEGLRPDNAFLRRPTLTVLCGSAAQVVQAGELLNPGGTHSTTALPVILTPSTLTLGPMLRPESSPCLQCAVEAQPSGADGPVSTNASTLAATLTNTVILDYVDYGTEHGPLNPNQHLFNLERFTMRAYSPAAAAHCDCALQYSCTST